MFLRLRRFNQTSSLPTLIVKPSKSSTFTSTNSCILPIHHSDSRYRLSLFLLSLFSFILLIWSISPTVSNLTNKVIGNISSLDGGIFQTAKIAISDWRNSNHPTRPSPHLFQDDIQNIHILINQAYIPPVFVSRLGINGRRKLLRRLATDTAGILHYKQIPKIIIADLQNGLGNRLRVLASAMEYAFYTRRILVVLWANDLHLNASMKHLFHPSVIDNFVLIQDSVSWPIDPNHLPKKLSLTQQNVYSRVHSYHSSRFSFRYFNFMSKDHNNEQLSNNRQIDDVHGKHIYVKTAYILESKYSSHILINAFMQALTPSSSVLKLVNNIQDSCGGPISLHRMIGVHIRARTLDTDNSWIDSECEYSIEGARTTNTWRRKSSPKHFIKEMKKMKQTWPSVIATSYALQSTTSWNMKSTIEMANSDQDINSITIVDTKIPPRFYVSADSLETIDLLYKVFDQHEVVTLGRNCDDRSAECMQYAFADMVLLSRTGAMLGSGWSSFTEAASRLRVRPNGIDPNRQDGYVLRLSGVHFAVPGIFERLKQMISTIFSWRKMITEIEMKMPIISQHEMNRRCEEKRTKPKHIISNQTKLR